MEQFVIVNARSSMLAEIEIILVGTGSPSLSAQLAPVAKLIDASGLDYRIGPMGTVVEGEWDIVMALVKRCHQAVLQTSTRVLTTIRIDDRKDKPGRGRIVQKVQSLETAAGRPLKR